MQSKILSQKPIFRKDGVDIIDLTAKVLEYRGQSVVVDAVMIDDDMEMRPDLIALAAYGISENWDFILKFNGISNPFSIEAGQYLLIPDISYMNSQITSDSKSNNSANNVRSQYIDENKKSKLDPNKAIYDKMLKNLTNQISHYNLPPNIAEPGKKEVSVKDGKVYLGGQD